MELYSIMALDTDHLEEICQDIREQVQSGVCKCPLFLITLVPEGVPAIDKASIQGKNYIPFRDRLAEMGIPSGLLVQCSIGHGYPLNQMFGFTQYENLTDGQKMFVACPADEGFRDYIRNQMATLAALKPDVIMVDDDFRLMGRQGMGCTCPLHMAMFRESTGADISRQELWNILRDRHHPLRPAYTEAFTETQRQSLLGAAKAMREGMDSVNPALPGIFCCVGNTTEYAADIARILAGEGHAPAVRINNGNYTAPGARNLSRIAYRCARQVDVLHKEGVRVVLAETDTCPQNRYSTGFQSLHAHFTASILEGANGAKHWITRLSTYEPASGRAYRKKLARHAGFYRTLANLVPDVTWQGCRIALPNRIDFGFAGTDASDGWANCVLERFGVPLYYSSAEGGAVCLDGPAEIYSDEEILAMCRTTLVLSSNTAAELCSRGFSEYLGVNVEPWGNLPASFEILETEGQKCHYQMGLHTLIPLTGTRTDSTVYHLHNGTERIPVAPGTTVYKNKLGGTVICFAGTPNTRFLHSEAFSFLCESRKEQIVRLLREAGHLPLYYAGDEEVFCKSGLLPGGDRFCSLINIGLDPIDEIVLDTETPVTEAEILTEAGEWESASLRKEDGRTVIERPMFTLEPVILRLR